MPNGTSCGLSSSHVKRLCYNGICKGRLGYIDVTVISANFPRSISSYVNVCIVNGTVPESLPIRNRKQCINCTTNLSPTLSNPRWNSVCANSGQNLFVPESRVTFEVWENRGLRPIFLGGNSITIQQMLNMNVNKQQMNRTIVGGNTYGTLSYRVSWTPKY
ncbi:hypothetical protein RDWZM_005317 [Blomia tropicalis]|uniref:C2 domain-containing protein n=1 Tax=Blomia tropicalis TaxID=40697 RepID=A0A9Q0RMI0_BLOTA|nr:hypothetical protein RDWZM_005317 [Blomia tropicalis]